MIVDAKIKEINNNNLNLLENVSFEVPSRPHKRLTALGLRQFIARPYN
jgi:hypothetical protein